MAEGTENLEVMEEAVRYNAYLLDLARTAGPAGARLLDFGAGLGTFARAMAADGRRMVCVETSESAQLVLRKAGLTVHDRLEDVPTASLDGGYSFNVLEHIEDDAAILRQIRRVLKPGAPFVVYVPAFELIYSSMDRRVGHVRRYRRGQLVRRLREAGFMVGRAEYVDSIGFAASLAYRLLGRDDGAINRGALRVYDRYVFPVSRVLDRLLKPVVGKNLLVVARAGDGRVAVPVEEPAARAAETRRRQDAAAPVA